jgi:hypothetical protein
LKYDDYFRCRRRVPSLPVQECRVPDWVPRYLRLASHTRLHRQ